MSKNVILKTVGCLLATILGTSYSCIVFAQLSNPTGKSIMNVSQVPTTVVTPVQASPPLPVATPVVVQPVTTTTPALPAATVPAPAILAPATVTEVTTNPPVQTTQTIIQTPPVVNAPVANVVTTPVPAPKVTLSPSPPAPVVSVPALPVEVTPALPMASPSVVSTPPSVQEIDELGIKPDFVRIITRVPTTSYTHEFQGETK